MLIYICLKLFVLLILLVKKSDGISSPLSPYIKYKNSIELQPDVADLWWTIDDTEKEITFEYHVKTTGWIGLGISPGGGMTGADIGIGWVDNAGKVHFQDRYALTYTRPILDNTTQDWHVIQGREENGWTSIQFKRLLDTCDEMDVPIKSGTNIVIFAYGTVDPDPSQMGSDITYHDTRRDTRMIPLRSYGNPPSAKKFAELDSFEFRLNNYLLPPTDTTYYCKIFKVPSRFTQKKHIIGYNILIDPESRNIVHHMTTFECDLSMKFDDENLPEGICNDITTAYSQCMSNIANGWAIGGDHIVEFTTEAGYPIGDEYSVKYVMLQLHFDNSKLLSNHYDRSGIRFFIGNQLRQYDLGYFTLGAQSGPGAIVIPPGVNQFSIDGYCPSKASERFPDEGLTVVSAFPHTHLQGRTVWTKVIRNQRAVQYLFNAESFNFNYQFENLLPKPVKVYKGDAFITRCVYDTMNKDEITLGGERTKDEMCAHTFTYYPRMHNLFICASMQANSAWETVVDNSTVSLDSEKFVDWLKELKWTPELKRKWQEFYNKGLRRIILGGANNFETNLELPLPEYEDIKVEPCQN